MILPNFNIHDGFAEAIVRGYRSGLLNVSDYNNLGQCDLLEGFFVLRNSFLFFVFYLVPQM